eukprot:c12625_g1_i4.p1 GENE.c12625_g1_i4~~c12625_g1_i4.p1  ORF type:complete len:775 (+),score=144.09 c12625_g1_i4:436-2760(+)
MQVCEAMERVSAIGLMHRDLSTRNVLVFEFHPQRIAFVDVRVGDFGLATDSSLSMSDPPTLPVRWMPPEALLHRRWSEKSDVWSFGVLLWEIFSNGELPFSEITLDEEVSAAVCDVQLRLEQPPDCPDTVYDVMNECWAYDPADRPTFHMLRQQLWELIIIVEESAAHHHQQQQHQQQQQYQQRPHTQQQQHHSTVSRSQPQPHDRSHRPKTRAPEAEQHTITWWKNGFAVDNGPLRRYKDPANQEFLQCIQKRVAPPELISATTDQIRLTMQERRLENCRQVEDVSPLMAGWMQRQTSVMIFFKSWKRCFCRLYPTHLLVSKADSVGEHPETEFDLEEWEAIPMPNNERGHLIMMKHATLHPYTLKLDSAQGVINWTTQINAVAKRGAHIPSVAQHESSSSSTPSVVTPASAPVRTNRSNINPSLPSATPSIVTPPRTFPTNHQPIAKDSHAPSLSTHAEPVASEAVEPVTVPDSSSPASSDPSAAPPRSSDPATATTHTAGCVPSSESTTRALASAPESSVTDPTFDLLSTSDTPVSSQNDLVAASMTPDPVTTSPPSQSAVASSTSASNPTHAADTASAKYSDTEVAPCDSATMPSTSDHAIAPPAFVTDISFSANLEAAVDYIDAVPIPSRDTNLPLVSELVVSVSDSVPSGIRHVSADPVSSGPVPSDLVPFDHESSDLVLFNTVSPEPVPVEPVPKDPVSNGPVSADPAHLSSELILALVDGSVPTASPASKPDLSASPVDSVLLAVELASVTESPASGPASALPSSL